MKKCVILGGGIAGLSAAIRLAELGHPPLLIEAGKYPGHRLCGEFLSPECLSILDSWGIHPHATIRSVRFIFNSKEVQFPLPHPAGSLSRYHLDWQLLERAKALGAEIRTETQVKTLIRPKNPEGVYNIQLADGSSIESKHLMIGTGRLQHNNNPPPPRYTGFKAHFEGVDMDETIEMHCFQGGYAGVSPVAPHTINITCLARHDLVHDLTTFMDSLANQKNMHKFHERYSSGRMLFSQWITAHVPEFGIKSNPSWPNTFWIGDAAGTIPPVCGEGLSIALTTGVMAADYFVNKDANTFRKDWHQRYHSRFLWGKYLHHIVMRPTLSSLGAICCHLLPSLPQKIFALTR